MTTRTKVIVYNRDKIEGYWSKESSKSFGWISAMNAACAWKTLTINGWTLSGERWAPPSVSE